MLLGFRSEGDNAISFKVVYIISINAINMEHKKKIVEASFDLFKYILVKMSNNERLEYNSSVIM